MGYSRLGQLATTTTQTIQRHTVRYPAMPAVYMPYAMPGMYAPGYRGQVDLNPEEVEKAVYKDLDKTIKEDPAAADTEPQKVIKTRTGLEVPQYLIQRDVARKKAARIAAAEAAKGPPPEIPPIFYKIGIFASKNPGMAAILALGIGAVAGNVYFDSRKDQ